MIRGVGIDSVEIERFNRWVHFTQKQLLRIFSPEEIAYSRSNKLKTAERFAARFAAKEAFYKALCQVLPGRKFPFLTLCKAVSVVSQGPPHLIVDWNYFFSLPDDALLQKYNTHISITHTRSAATVVVIIEEGR